MIGLGGPVHGAGPRHFQIGGGCVADRFGRGCRHPLIDDALDIGAVDADVVKQVVVELVQVTDGFAPFVPAHEPAVEIVNERE